MNLRGKVILVTGGARMGAALAAELDAAGATTVFSYRTTRPAKGRPAHRADLRRASDVRTLMRAVIRGQARLDGVVHLASTYDAVPLRRLGDAAWREALDGNLETLRRVALEAARVMKRGGAVVTCADWTAASGRPTYKDYAGYYAAKAAVIGLTEALALELAPSIVVNCLAPGPILPPPGLSPAKKRAVERATPLRRWGGPQELAKAARFLLETGFITGETLRLDGGRHLL